MLIVFNPPAAAKDRILINPTQVGTVHPVCERRSTVDPVAEQQPSRPPPELHHFPLKRNRRRQRVSFGARPR